MKENKIIKERKFKESKDYIDLCKENLEINNLYEKDNKSLDFNKVQKYFDSNNTNNQNNIVIPNGTNQLNEDKYNKYNEMNVNNHKKKTHQKLLDSDYRNDELYHIENREINYKDKNDMIDQSILETQTPMIKIIPWNVFILIFILVLLTILSFSIPQYSRFSNVNIPNIIQLSFNFSASFHIELIDSLFQSIWNNQDSYQESRLLSMVYFIFNRFNIFKYIFVNESNDSANNNLILSSLDLESKIFILIMKLFQFISLGIIISIFLLPFPNYPFLIKKKLISSQEYQKVKNDKKMNEKFNGNDEEKFIQNISMNEEIISNSFSREYFNLPYPSNTSYLNKQNDPFQIDLNEKNLLVNKRNGLTNRNKIKEKKINKNDGNIIKQIQVEENIFSSSKFHRIIIFLWNIVLKLVFSFSIIYMMMLLIACFISIEDSQSSLRFLFHFSPVLDRKLEKDYAVDCTPNWTNIYEKVNDVFFACHFFGWLVKALIFRDLNILLITSVLWELIEKSFTFLLPNFKECWWDSWILDVLICNSLGILIGLKIIKLFNLKKFNWFPKALIETKDIERTSKLDQSKKIINYYNLNFKVCKITLQWSKNVPVNRIISSFLFTILIELNELNCFILKDILGVHFAYRIVLFRLFLWSLLSIPGVYQVYEFIESGHKKVGAYGWMSYLLLFMETILTFRWGLFIYSDITVPLKIYFLWIFGGLLLFSGIMIYTYRFTIKFHK